MTRPNFNIEMIEAALSRVPEGYLDHNWFSGKFGVKKQKIVDLIVNGSSRIKMFQHWFYDSTRITPERITDLKKWCKPQPPEMTRSWNFTEATIDDRLKARAELLNQQPELYPVIERMAGSRGYVAASELPDEQSVQFLIQKGFLKRHLSTIYDPLRLSLNSIKPMAEDHHARPLQRELLAWLAEQPGQAVQEMVLIQKAGGRTIYDLIRKLPGLTTFVVPYTAKEKMTWVRRTDADPAEAERAARETIKAIKAEVERQANERWEHHLSLCGDVLRPGAREGKKARMRVIARTYRPKPAAKRLGLKEDTLRDAVRAGKLLMFKDNDGYERIPAYEIEAAYQDPEYAERFAVYEVLKVKEIASVCGVVYSTVRRRLEKAGLSRTAPRWADVRGKWELPATFREFHDIYRAKIDEALAKARAEREAWREQRRREQEEREARKERERREREILRAKLIAAFPAWQHEDRTEQRVFLHIGPTNSGKTYAALQHLKSVKHGWYLAPLRLLAFEIFDTLNQQGIPCNLLTGEEHIPVPDARITASTIEMFDPRKSGQCVIIDEAHMFADPDRGWAWTRALMEAQSPEIHVIGSPIARPLITHMAQAAALPCEVIEYERLTPLRMADRPFSLSGLPPRTILVAFSRRTVLGLKATLEDIGRSVSIVYGNLPPEVRRRQADRFANGETDICVATDAVGMGLNLPADYVVFAQIKKFDGKEHRELTPNEVRQIGGRAGRYGLSEFGVISALAATDLKLVRKLYEQTPPNIHKARVAPSVEDIAMIPGTLAERLRKWSRFDSIPEHLTQIITTGDMTERIELAGMLSPSMVEMLGLDHALKLINAPTRNESRSYWRQCVDAILGKRPLPLPPTPPARINSDQELSETETCILCADVYLWLFNRWEFAEFAPDEEKVHRDRQTWSMRVDEALVRKADTAPRCTKCGRKLDYNHPFKICDSCYRQGRSFRYDYYDDFYDDDDYYYTGHQYSQIIARRQPKPRSSKTPLPVAKRLTENACPGCGKEITPPEQRIIHWKTEHAEFTELTVTYASWVVNQKKQGFGVRVRFDEQNTEENPPARYWKLSTLEALLNKGKDATPPEN